MLRPTIVYSLIFCSIFIFRLSSYTCVYIVICFQLGSYLSLTRCKKNATIRPRWKKLNQSYRSFPTTFLKNNKDSWYGSSFQLQRDDFHQIFHAVAEAEKTHFQSSQNKFLIPLRQRRSILSPGPRVRALRIISVSFLLLVSTSFTKHTNTSVASKILKNSGGL